MPSRAKGVAAARQRPWLKHPRRPAPWSVSRPPSATPPGTAVDPTASASPQTRWRPRTSFSSPHHRISVKRVCTITTFNSHCTYLERLNFFYVMSLPLAQVRPADLYIHSLMLYDIHATTSSAYK